MSKEIEQRVVQMKFDNAQFEAGTKQTLSTLDKLKEKLKFNDVEDSFSKIANSAKKVDMTSVANSVETTRLKFSALEVIAVGALTKIGASLTDLATKTLKTFTVDPIMQGFSEYELKMGSVQTIMASTGESIDVVNKYLNELNEYSDKTIYSFSDMTSNIGKFTNAGVKLDVAVAAMQGIANAAALSGANSQQASSAMYNFSQAMSAGYMGLVDWNSIANTAGMGTLAFKEELIKTAVELGTLIETEEGYISTTTNLQGKVSEAFDASTQFTNSLQHRWMTTDVLTKTLSKYSDTTTELGKAAAAAAQDVKTFSGMMDSLKESVGSGWAQTWEILIGNLEEAKAFWTPINNVLSDIISKSSDARNKVLQEWVDLGGKDHLLEGFKNFFTGLGDIFNRIGTAFKDAFGVFTGADLEQITHGFSNLLTALKPTEGVLNGIQKAFQTFFNVIKLGINVLKIPLELLPIFEAVLEKLGQAIKIVAPGFGDLSNGISDFINSSDGAAKIIQNVSDAVGIVAQNIANFIRTLSLDSFKNLVDSLSNIVEKVLSKIRGLKDQLSGALDFRGVLNPTNNLLQKFGDILNAIPWDSVVKGILGGGGLVFAFTKLTNFSKSLTGYMDKFLGIFKPFGDIAGEVKSAIGAITEGLKGAEETLTPATWKDLGIGIGLVAASLLVLSSMETSKLGNAMASLTLIMGVMTAFSALSNKYGGLGSAKGLIGFGTSILLLATAFEKLGDIPLDKMEGASLAISLLAGLITTFSLVTSKFNGDHKAKLTELIGFTASILILVQGVEQLGQLNTDQLNNGLAGITVLVMEMTAVIAIISNIPKIDMTKVLSMITFAASMSILADAMAGIGSMSWEQIAKGLVGLAGVLTEMVLVTYILAKIDTKSIGFKMVSMAAGLTAMYAPLKLIGDMEWEQIAKGLVGIAGVMAEIVAFTMLIPDKSFLGAAASITLLSAGILVISEAVKSMGSLDWNEIAVGLTGLAGILTSIALFTAAMPDKDLTKIGAGLVIMSAGIAVIGSVMKDLSSLSWEQLATGLLGMAGALTSVVVASRLIDNSGSTSLVVAAAGLTLLCSAFKSMSDMSWGEIGMSFVSIATAIGLVAGAALLLKPVSPAILSLSVSLTAFSASIVVLGAGLSLLGAGLALVGGSLVTAVYAIEQAFDGLVNIVKMALESIIDLAPLLAEAFGAVLVAVLDVIVDSIDVIVDAIMNLLVSVVQSLSSYAGPLIDGLGDFILVVIRGLSKYVPQIIKEGVKLIGDALIAIFDAVGQFDSDALLKCVVAAGGFGLFVAALSALVPLIPGAALGLVGFGALVAEFMGILALLGALNKIDGLQELMNGGAEILQFVGECIGNFLGSIVEGFTDNLPDIGENLSDFMNKLTPFLDGIKKIDESSVDNVGHLVAVIAALTATSFLDKIGNFLTGGNNLKDLGKELSEFGPMIADFCNTISSIGDDDIVAAANAGKAIGEFMNSIPNSGGLKSLFTGSKDLVELGEQLTEFAPLLVEFSKSVKEVDSAAITKSADAAKALADFANKVPNVGGMASWFAGDNDLKTFGKQLVAFGESLSAYSESVKNVDPGKVQTSAKAAQSVVDMSNSIGNSGGMASWFAGDNDLKTFGKQLVAFGESLSAYSESVTNVNVGKIQTSVTAAKLVIDMANTIGNSGGMASWFAGDNDLETFGKQLVVFGSSLSSYSDSVSSVNTSKVAESATASKSIVDMANTIGNSGGMVSWFTGDNDLGNFGINLVAFGRSLSTYSDSVVNINTSKVSESATAAKSIVDMANSLQNSGGLKSLFTGDNDLGTFGRQLVSFGQSLAAYSSMVSIIDNAAITNAKTSFETVVQMANNNADTDLEGFGDQLRSLGQDMNSFYGDVKSIDSGALTNVSTGLTQVKTACSELANINTGLISELGTAVSSAVDSISAACTDLINNGVANFKSVGSLMMINVANGIRESSSSPRTAAQTAGTDIMTHLKSGIDNSKSSVMSSIQNVLTGVIAEINRNNSNMSTAGTNMMTHLKTGIDNSKSSVMSSIQNVLTGVIAEINRNNSNMSTAGTNMMTHLKTAINNSKSSVMSSIQNVLTGIIAEINRNNSNMSTAGSTLITNLINGINQKSSTVSTTVGNMCKNMNTAIRNYYNTFKSAGEYLSGGLASGIQSGASNISNKIKSAVSSAPNVARGYYWDMYSAGSYMMQGLANGISDNSYAAAAAAAAAARSAATAAKEALLIQSPSKVFEEIGMYVDMGLAQGISKYSNISDKSAKTTAENAAENMRKALSTILNDDFSDDVVIRPVLDLSDIQNGVGQMNSMLNNSIAATRSTTLANSISGRISSPSSGNVSNVSNNTNNTEIINHFNITGDNPQAIANEVNKILNKQIERREAVWA